jgi:cytochrome P450
MAERARHPVRDDLVGDLMASEKTGKLSHSEVLGYLYILSIVGNETTTKDLQQHLSFPVSLPRREVLSG